MGGFTTIPAATALSPRWYVRHIAVTRAESGFARSQFLIEVAFGDTRAELDPVTNSPLFTVYGQRVLSFSGAELLEWLGNMPAGTREALMQSILEADTALITAVDALLAALARRPTHAGQT